MRWLLALILMASIAGGWHWWTHEREVSRAPGVLVAEDPQQRNLETPRTFDARGHTFVVRAGYDITARVLRKEVYRVDGGADLAPVDLALGWGPMSDSRIVDLLDFSQMGRFFYWRPHDPATFPLVARDLVANAGQVHAIPATPDVERRLKRLRPGQIVRMSGSLVDVRGPGGFTWNTSLTREDKGAGACEIMWIEALDVE